MPHIISIYSCIQCVCNPFMQSLVFFALLASLFFIWTLLPRVLKTFQWQKTYPLLLETPSEKKKRVNKGQQTSPYQQMISLLHNNHLNSLLLDYVAHLQYKPLWIS